MIIALATTATLVGLAALLWYFYRLGEKSQRYRAFQEQIREVEERLHGAVSTIPDEFYRTLDPNYIPNVQEQLAQTEFEEREHTDYSIEPNS
mgnify:CR=1 FL=1